MSDLQARVERLERELRFSANRNARLRQECKNLLSRVEALRANTGIAPLLEAREQRDRYRSSLIRATHKIRQLEEELEAFRTTDTELETSE